MTLGTGYDDGWVLANGVRTHYSWAGTEGPVVLLIHGGGPGASGETGWRYMLPALAEAGFRALAPDQLSMGWTDVRPHAWPVLGHQSLVDHVNDFLDALCVEEVAVVGNSQGAYVSAKLALDHPEKVTKAFLMGSGTISNAMGIDRPLGVAGYDALKNYDETPEGMRNFLEVIVNDKSKVSEELVRVRHEAATRPGAHEARAAFNAYRKRMDAEPKLLARFKMENTLPNFTIPARFIWGKADTFAPVSMGYELEKLLPNIPFEYIDNCGHQCQTDQPEVVNEMVIDFLRS